MRVWPVSALALVLVSASSACTATAPPPADTATNEAPSAPLAAELEPASYFVGTWVGASTSAADGKVTSLTWQVEPSLDGRWLSGRARAEDLGVDARDYLGATATGFVRIYLDSQGTHGLLFSEGWHEGTWIWEGELIQADGNASTLRQTITQIDSDTLHARYQLAADTSGADWTQLSEETLSRQPGTRHQSLTAPVPTAPPASSEDESSEQPVDF